MNKNVKFRGSHATFLRRMRKTWLSVGQVTGGEESADRLGMSKLCGTLARDYNVPSHAGRTVGPRV